MEEVRIAIRYTALAEKQYDLLTLYLMENFGALVTAKRLQELEARINLLKALQKLAPVYLMYKGYSVRQLTYKRSHIFYTVHSDTVYILSIADTRMSPVTVKQMITDEMKRLNL